MFTARVAPNWSSASHEFDQLHAKFCGGQGTTGRGSGIGLSLVARIAGIHSAELVTSAGLGGKGFGISLHFKPALQRPHTDAPAREAKPLHLTNAAASLLKG